MEVSLSGSKGRRRVVPSALPDPGADLWLYAADNGYCIRAQDEKECAEGIRGYPGEMEIFGISHLPCTGTDHDILFCSLAAG